MKLKEKVDSEVVQHEIKYAEFEQAQAEFDKLKEKEKGFSVDMILNAIKEKLSDFEAEESEIVKQFKNKDLDLDSYIEQFRKVREQIAKYDIIKRKLQA